MARGLQVEGNFGTAHVYRSSLNAIIAYRGKDDFAFNEVTSEWLKGFEVYLRSRGCSWNTVSTYLRTFRAVYNRAVDLHRAPYVPHLFRSVYTGTRADHKRALCDDDMKKVYSIWVCMQAPKKIGNAISEYSIKKQDIISGLPDRPESYDKLSVVIIALNEKMETNDELLGMLNTLFSEQKTYLEKKKELEEIYQMRMDNELGKEMNLMCNLSDLVIERGIEQGIESGIEQKSYNLAQMMIREAEPTDKIMRYTGYSLEKIKEIAQEMGKVWPLA